MSEQRPVPTPDSASSQAASHQADASPTGARARTGAPGATVSEDTRLAVEIRALVADGQMDEARDRFAGLVSAHQRRALRIAYQYLRDAAEADEAVQDAFVKVFTHIASYRDAWPFEVWFTRILINGCLDRRKARARRERWFIPSDDGPQELAREPGGRSAEPDPESRLLARERRGTIAAAIDRLDGRQRTVFMLSHYGDCSPRDISAMTGINESTVRVHLFRAVRKLRGFLGGKS